MWLWVIFILLVLKNLWGLVCKICGLSYFLINQVRECEMGDSLGLLKLITVNLFFIMFFLLGNFFLNLSFLSSKKLVYFILFISFPFVFFSYYFLLFLSVSLCKDKCISRALLNLKLSERPYSCLGERTPGLLLSLS